MEQMKDGGGGKKSAGKYEQGRIGMKADDANVPKEWHYL